MYAWSRSKARHCISFSKRSDHSESQGHKSQWLEIAEWARTELNSIPKHKRILVTSHDAFRYFGEFYDIEVIALQGISTSQEAGLADRTNLVDFIREKGIGCVCESSVNPKAIKEIANETGISIGAPLYSDALGDGSQIVIGPRENLYHAILGQV